MMARSHVIIGVATWIAAAPDPAPPARGPDRPRPGRYGVVAAGHRPPKILGRTPHPADLDRHRLNLLPSRDHPLGDRGDRTDDAAPACRIPPCRRLRLDHRLSLPPRGRHAHPARAAPGMAAPADLGMCPVSHQLSHGASDRYCSWPVASPGGICGTTRRPADLTAATERRLHPDRAIPQRRLAPRSASRNPIMSL